MLSDKKFNVKCNIFEDIQHLKTDGRNFNDFIQKYMKVTYLLNCTVSCFHQLYCFPSVRFPFTAVILILIVFLSDLELQT